jgi:hypothetical protein
MKRIDIPPAAVPLFPKLKAAIGGLRALEEEQRLVDMGLRNRIAGREDAQRKDLQDYARAIREGKPDPRTPRQDRLDAEVEALRRRSAAVKEAVDQARRELGELVEFHRDEWIAVAKDREADAREAYRRALDAVTEANEGVREADLVVRFVALFPEVRGKMKRGTGITGLRSPSGDAYRVPALLDALRAEADLVPNYDLVRESRPHVLTVEEARQKVRREQEERWEQGFEERPRPPRPTPILGGQGVQIIGGRAFVADDSPPRVP